MVKVRRQVLFTLWLIVFSLGSNLGAQSQTSEVIENRIRAIRFAEDNRYIDALPLFEKIATLFPNDVAVWTHYGIAIAINSATLKDPQQRKNERRRAYEALRKANQLGTKNVTALSLLDQLPPNGGDEDNFLDENPDVEKALREGEQHFGKGDNKKAFISYERAFKLNPTSYEAAVFAGDTFYAQKKYAESEPWFARAAAINPDREMAYRFWGDALLGQKKTKDAQEKFIDAFIAEPYIRYTWENINKLVTQYNKQFDVKGIFPPGTDGFEGIRIDQSSLRQLDGSNIWLKYVEVRDAWRRDLFKKQFPDQQYRHSLKEEVAALNAVAELADRSMSAGEIKQPHHSLVNLLDLRKKGMIEAYLLLLTPSDGLSEDYIVYRNSNRAKLRKFLVDHVFVF